MRIPIILQTKFGFDLYNIIAMQYNDYIKRNSGEEFKSLMFKERVKVDRELANFLNDKESEKKYKMDETDTEGWNLFKFLADKYTIFQYFETRKTCL